MIVFGMMFGMTNSWTCQHLSLANPRADGSSDLPRLLRRFADEIERLGIGPSEILDLTVSSEITDDGPWWSATLYWSQDEIEPHSTEP
jgi:hypothetical protein